MDYWRIDWSDEIPTDGEQNDVWGKKAPTLIEMTQLQNSKRSLSRRISTAWNATGQFVFIPTLALLGGLLKSKVKKSNNQKGKIKYFICFLSGKT